MNINLISILFLVFSIISTKGKCQEITFIKQYDTFAKHLSKPLKDIYIKSNSDQINRKDILSVFVMPTYKFVCSSPSSFMQSDNTTCLELDTQHASGLVSMNSNPVGLAFKQYTLFSVITFYNLSDKALSEKRDITLIQEARKRSDKVFNLYFDYYLPRNDWIAYLQNNEIKIIDTSLKIWTISQFLNNRYGSIPKALEVLNFSKEKENAVNSIFNDEDSILVFNNCIKFLKSNFHSISNLFPEDTLRVMTSLYNEFENLGFPNNDQIRLFHKKIENLSFPNKNNEKDQPIFDLYGYDIKIILDSILTEEQLNSYLKTKKILSYLETKCKNFLLFQLLDQFHADSLSDSRVVNAYKELLK